MSNERYIWTPDQGPPELDLHSRTKHEVLRSYLERYVGTLTQDPRLDTLRLTLVDGFAGGGEYVDSQSKEICFGSPILMIEAMLAAEKKAKAARSKKAFELDVQYIFVEKNLDAVRYLTDVVNKQRYPRSLRDKIDIRHGSFEQNLARILEAVKRHSKKASRVIFALDQYGYKDVPFDLLRTIFSDINKPEVILTFATDWLLDYLSDTEQSKQILTRLGLRGDYSSAAAIKREFGDEWRRVIQLALHDDIHVSSGADFYTPFFIRSAEAHRDYWLVHLSNHMRARDVMMGLHWEKQNHFHFEHDGRPGLKMLGYDPSRDFEAQGYSKLLFEFDDDAHTRMMSAILGELPERIANAPDGITVHELLSAITNESPATHEDLKTALKTLSLRDEIIVKDKGGKLRQLGVNVDLKDRVLIRRNKYLTLSFPE